MKPSIRQFSSLKMEASWAAWVSNKATERGGQREYEIGKLSFQGINGTSIKLSTLSPYINLGVFEVTGKTNRAPTCPISDGQVVPFLQDDIQLVHGWTRRSRRGLCITGPQYVDALCREDVT